MAIITYYKCNKLETLKISFIHNSFRNVTALYYITLLVCMYTVDSDKTILDHFSYNNKPVNYLSLIIHYRLICNSSFMHCFGSTKVSVSEYCVFSMHINHFHTFLQIHCSLSFVVVCLGYIDV